MTEAALGVGRLVAWFRENLAFRREDGRAALLVVVLHALVGSALVVAFAARDAVFLSTTPEKLPVAYLVAAILAGFAAAGVADLRRRLPAELLYPVMAALAGSTLFALGLLAWKKGDALAARPTYLVVDALAAAVLVPLWSLTESTFTARDTRRVIALADVARLVVVALAGLWTWGIVHVLAPRWLLVVAAGLLWLSSVPVILLNLQRALRGGPSRVTREPLGSGFGAARLPHVRLLALVMMLGAIVVTLVDFVFKTELARRSPGDAVAIARFVSGYASFSGGLAIVITLGAAPFLYRRYGVVGVLVGCAAATAAGLVLGMTPLVAAFSAAVVAKATHESFRFSGTESTLPRFLAPLPRQLRDDAASLIRSYALPLATVLAAALILGTHDRAPMAIPVTGVVAAAGLVLALQRFRTEFARSRQYGVSHSPGRGAAGYAFVAAALRSPDQRDIETALEVAPRALQDLRAAVAPLIAHGSPRVRRLALEYLSGRASQREEGAPDDTPPELVERIRLSLGDPDADVRASAVRATCAMKRAGALGDLLPFLHAPESQVRAAAAAALFFHGGSTGQAAGARPLMKLLGSADPAEREALGEALAAVGHVSCTQPVLALIDDEDPRVRRSAIKAAGRIRTEPFLPVIVDALAKNETARVAREALAGYGEAVLGRVLREHARSRAVVAEVARILGRLGTDAAIEVLMDHLDDHDESMRGAILAALAHAAFQHPTLRLDTKRLEGALVVEAAAAYRALAMSEAFRHADEQAARGQNRRGPAPARRDRAGALIGWAVGEKFERALGRLLRVAQALNPDAVLSRASAAEVLPNILTGVAKDAALPLFGPASVVEKLNESTGVLRPPFLSAEQWVRELLTDGDRWIVCAAAHYAGARRLAALEERLEALLDRRDAVIRETALQALERLLPTRRLPGAVKRVLWDDDPGIQKSVDRLLERIVDQVEFDRAEGAAQEAFNR